MQTPQRKTWAGLKPADHCTPMPTWGSALAQDYSTKSQWQSMDTFNFSCNLIVIKVSIISTKFPHLVLYKEVLVQPSCVCKSQICSNFTFSSMLQHHASDLVRFPPGNKYSPKNTWSQLVKVVLKHVEFSLSPPVWTDVMRRNERSKSVVFMACRSVQLWQLGWSVI